MRVEFNQGVSQECIDWLWENVGQGNVQPKVTGPLRTFPTAEHDAWFYERVIVYPQPEDPFVPSEKFPKYVPTVTVKDPKLATWFVLRWS